MNTAIYRASLLSTIADKFVDNQHKEIKTAVTAVVEQTSRYIHNMSDPIHTNLRNTTFFEELKGLHSELKKMLESNDFEKADEKLKKSRIGHFCKLYVDRLLESNPNSPDHMKMKIDCYAKELQRRYEECSQPHDDSVREPRIFQVLSSVGFMPHMPHIKKLGEGKTEKP